MKLKGRWIRKSCYTLELAEDQPEAQPEADNGIYILQQLTRCL
jgi:hypothetical protein